MRRGWAKQETMLFRAIYPHKKNEDLQRIFNRSINSIQRKASCLGLTKTREHIYRTWSEAHSGNNSPLWKGGRSASSTGHIYVTTPDGKRILEHRYLMEKHLGRKLFTTEAVHHINGNRADNRIENLAIMERGEHTTFHHKGLRHTAETKKKLSAIVKERLGDRSNHPGFKDIDAQKLIEARQTGLTVNQIAKNFGICKKTYYNKIQEMEACING